MAQESGKGVAVIQQQLKELDDIVQDTMSTLNIVSGTERISKWRAKTAALLSESVGQKAGQDFANIQPGPSFTNDMVEEFTDLVDCFRTPLVTLSKSLSRSGSSPAGGG